MRADDPRELRDARNAAHLKFAAVVCEDRVVGDVRVESVPYRRVAFRRFRTIQSALGLKSSSF